MDKEKDWDEIELFEKGEIAVVWHPIKFMIIDPKTSKRLEECPSLRLSKGDEIYIVEGYKEKYGCKENIPIGTEIPQITYIGMFRYVRGFISSAGLQHKDENKNKGQHMHSKCGWTI
jgi:hypothetical protein